MTTLHPAHSATGRRLILSAVAVMTAIGLAACSSSSSDDDTAANGAARTYESEFGPIELPAKIDRIVSVDFYTPAALVDLGVNPVGVVNSYFTDTKGATIPSKYATAVKEGGAESIGEYYELNLEAVIKADPDLILATDDFLPLDDKLRPQLEKVAPILTFPARDGESWRTRATALAEILDKEDLLKPLEDEYNAKRDAFKAEYADVIDTNRFSVFVPAEDEWGTYADTHFTTPILRDLGVKFREQKDDEINEAKFPNWFSYEALNRLDNADVLLTAAASKGLEPVKSSTIWKNLPAVKNGMVFDYIERSPTGSFGWAIGNLDDLDAVFAQVRAQMAAQEK